MAHLKPLLIRYFWVLLGGTVVATLFGLLMLMLTATAFPLLTSVPIAIAGFDAGREYRLREGKGPGVAGGLSLAAILFLITLALYVFIYVGSVMGQGGGLGVALSDLAFLAGPILFVSVLYFALLRVMMWLGSLSVR